MNQEKAEDQLKEGNCQGIKNHIVTFTKPIEFEDKSETCVEKIYDYQTVCFDIDTTTHDMFSRFVTIGACHLEGDSTFYEHVEPYVTPVVNKRRPNNLTMRKLDKGEQFLYNTRTKVSFLTSGSMSDVVLRFIQWMKEICGKSDGIVIAGHELNDLSTLILVDVINKTPHKEEFKKCVKYFLNTIDLAYHNLPVYSRSYELHDVVDALFGNATRRNRHRMEKSVDRARLICNIIKNLLNKETPHFNDFLDFVTTQDEIQRMVRSENDKVVKEAVRRSNRKDRQPLDMAALIHEGYEPPPIPHHRHYVIFWPPDQSRKLARINWNMILDRVSFPPGHKVCEL